MNGGTNKMMSEQKYNQFKAMKAIALASFRSITRNPSAVIFSIAFPLVFIVAFGFINGNRIKMEVGIDPQSDTTGTIYHSFVNSPNVDLQRNLSQSELTERLNKGRVDAVLKFDKTNSTNTEVVEIMTSQASREKGMFVRSLVSNLIDKQNIEYYKNVAQHVDSSTIAIAREITKPTELIETKIPGREYKMIDFILPGQLGFSILSASVFGTAFVFFSLRQTLVLKRFFATPIRRPYIILGEALSRLIF